jgi:nucleoside-diphosphate-sugar epimerase
VADNHEVIVLKRRASPLTCLSSVLGHIRLHNLEDGGLRSALGAHGRVEVVLHFATCYGGDGEPFSALLGANVVGPLRVIESAVQSGVSAFINADTSLPPETNHYARAKRYFLECARQAVSGRCMRLLNMRLEHLYGPGHNNKNFISRVIHACCSNQQYMDFTHGEQVRDFIYIDDVVAAYQRVLDLLSVGRELDPEYSVGTGLALRLRQVVELIRELSRSSIELRFGAIPYREAEPMRLVANIEPLVQIGWSPTVSLEDGLARTIREEKKRWCS